MTDRHLPISSHSCAAADTPVASPLAKVLAGLIALAIAMGIGRFAFTPLLPMMLQDAGLSISGAAWLASANYLGYLIGALSAMGLRLVPPRAIRAGLVLIVIATFAMGYTQSFQAWLCLRLIAGVASAWVLIAVSAWSLAALAVYQKPLFSSMVFSGVGCGMAVAGIASLVQTERHAGSATTWMALGLMAATATALVWRYFRADQTLASVAADAASAGGNGSKRFQWNSDAIRLVCCYGVFGFGYIIPATFLPVMAKNLLQDSSLFAWLWPVFGLAAAVSTLLVAVLVRTMSRRHIWMLSQLLMAFGIVLPVVSPQLLTVFVASLCVGGNFMIITLVALQEARQTAGHNSDYAGHHAATLIAAMTSAFACGQIIGPLTINATLNGNARFSSGLVMAAVLLALATLLLRKPLRKPASDKLQIFNQGVKR
ncbi:YbfB/YjiJ family MFS transporter [Undibacterium sp. Ren11W]|uniref:YbfB/YjiJ family MFS transporter n=1 Tax=Undibacterium sp. Ren11W TaxID=3413045 RepID=UPI003BF3D15E